MHTDAGLVTACAQAQAEEADAEDDADVEFSDDEKEAEYRRAVQGQRASQAHQPPGRAGASMATGDRGRGARRGGFGRSGRLHRPKQARGQAQSPASGRHPAHFGGLQSPAGQPGVSHSLCLVSSCA